MNETQTSRRGRLFYGWVIVLCCMLLSAASGILSGVLSTFFKPVSEALGVSRSAFSLTSTVLNLTIMLMMPSVAGIFRRVPLRRTVICSAVFAATAVFCFSFARSLVVFYVLSALCGFFSCFMNAVPIVILTSNWFVEKRGVATSISFSGMGLSSMLLSPLAAKLIETSSWQTAYRVVGIAFFLLSVPSSVFLLKEKPADCGLQPLGAAHAAESGRQTSLAGFSHKETIRQKSFWLFAVAIAFISMTSYGVQQHAIAYWSDLGYPVVEAARWYSVMMAIGIASKACMGAVYDKFGIRKASTFVCVTACLAYVMFNFCGNRMLLICTVVLFGVSSGIQIVPPTYITNRLFGDQDYSANYGLITTIYYLGMAIGIPFSAFWHDSFDSYRPAWCIYACMIAAALVLIFAAEHSARKARKGAFGIPYDLKN